MLHQLRLGAPGLIIADTVIAAHRGREAVMEEALRGAHKQMARSRLHIVFLKVLEEVGFNFRAARRELGCCMGKTGQSLFCLFCSEAGSQGQHHAWDVLVYAVGGMLASERLVLRPVITSFLGVRKESGPVCSGRVGGAAWG